MASIWTWPDSVIVRVKDGDSVIAKLTRDIGFHGSVTYLQSLRLNRVNCPPGSTEVGAKATQFTSAFALVGSLLIDTVKPYKYGDEWMAEITNPQGTNLSDALVLAGLAQYWDGTGPRPGG